MNFLLQYQNELHIGLGLSALIHTVTLNNEGGGEKMDVTLSVLNIITGIGYDCVFFPAISEND